MFDDRNFVDEIMEQSGAMLIVQELHEKLLEEQRKRAEFYETINEKDKVEFINGEIVYHSPIVKEHNDATGSLLKLLDTYVHLHQLGWVGFKNVMVQFTRNAYEPDVCFFMQRNLKISRKTKCSFPCLTSPSRFCQKAKKPLSATVRSNSMTTQCTA